MHYTSLNNPARQHLQQLYRDQIQENRFLAIGAIALEKAEELGLLDPDAENDIEKGRPAMPIGAKATWGGIEYIKTASGWKPVGKHRGHVKANHDFIHRNEEKDKDHHTMVLDAGKMSADEWAKKHGSTLHSKYKEVHDYLHKPKAEKPNKHPEGTGSDGKHGLANEEGSALMKQHLSIKEKYPDAILAYRVGDYYETFGDDAKKLADATGITLAKNKNGTHLAGFRHEALDKHLQTAIKAGHKVGIVEDGVGEKDKKGVSKKEDPKPAEKKDFPLPFEDGADKAMQKLKEKKQAERNPKEFEGIEVGKEYDHHAFGKVKVIGIYKDGDTRNKILVGFSTPIGNQLQGIDGFKTSLEEYKQAGNKTFHDVQMEKWEKENKERQAASKLFDKNGATEAGKKAYKEALEKHKPDSLQGMNQIRQQVFGDEAFYDIKLAGSLKGVMDEYWKGRESGSDREKAA